MDDDRPDSYFMLKRRYYLAILPIVFIYNAWYWLYSPVHDAFINFALPGAVLTCFILWILIYRNRAIQACDFAGLAIFTLYHLWRMYASAHTVGKIDLHLTGMTLYNLYVFIVFRGKKGLVYSLSIFILTLCIWIPHYPQIRIRDYTLNEFYVSDLIYIVVLYYFQRLFLAYAESTAWKKMAFYDYLTNIANRRMIDRWIENEIERSEEDNTSFSIIYFDIDHFKQLNDQFGHHVGDSILREFADVVKCVIRHDDYFGRWGGEEFIIVSPNEPLQKTEQFAERIRKTIEEHSFQEVGTLTASFGIASFNNSDRPNTLFNRADLALYAAKNGGRNIVRVAGV